MPSFGSTSLLPVHTHTAPRSAHQHSKAQPSICKESQSSLPQPTVHRNSNSRRSCVSLRLCWFPKSGSLWKLLALTVGLIIAFHAASCGYFFCVRFPGLLELPGNMYDDVTAIYDLSGGPRVIPSYKHILPRKDQAPKLIPQIIHQTYKSSQVPNNVRPMMHSWRHVNPNWEIRFYDDEACRDFVAKEFPEYVQAYRGLPKHVERSDFFRYLVVLRMGGVYADVDTESRKPLDSIIKPKDTLLVGWENEFATQEIAAHRNYARTRQVLQWVFAAAPGHPALREICDHIAQNVYTQFSQNTNRDTLERTGPGVFTDFVLKHAAMHPPSKRDDPWTVRILPRVHWGVHPVGLDGIEPDAPGISVLHHFLGKWKTRGGWSSNRFNLYRLWHQLVSFTKHEKRLKSADIMDLNCYPCKCSIGMCELACILHCIACLDSNHNIAITVLSIAAAKVVDMPSWQAPHQLGLFPVSVEWEPPFTMLVDLIGHGDHMAGTDVSACLTAWGNWQPALGPTRGPTVLDALIGSLGSRSTDKVLLDIGAGQGLFSLAAAARGHKAIAFELSAKSLASLEASIAFSSLHHLVDVHKVALGSQQEEICVERGPPSAPKFGGANPASIPANLRHQVDVARGYSHPHLHNMSAKTSADAAGSDAQQQGLPLSACTRTAQRLRGDSIITNTTKVAAMRVGANGWEADIIAGLGDVIVQSPPSVILLELNPLQMAAVGAGDAPTLLQRLYDLGYTDISHSGYVCDERWYNLTRSIRLRGLGFAGQDNLRQPTWCTLPPDKFRAFAARASQKAPENILLIYKAALKPVSREARLVDVRSSSILSNDAVRIPLPNASSPDPT